MLNKLKYGYFLPKTYSICQNNIYKATMAIYHLTKLKTGNLTVEMYKNVYTG